MVLVFPWRPACRTGHQRTPAFSRNCRIRLHRCAEATAPEIFPSRWCDEILAIVIGAISRVSLNALVHNPYNTFEAIIIITEKVILNGSDIAIGASQCKPEGAGGLQDPCGKVS